VPAGHEMLQFLDHNFTHLTRPLLFWKSAEWCRPVRTRPAPVNASRSLRSGNLAKVRRVPRPLKKMTPPLRRTVCPLAPEGCDQRTKPCCGRDETGLKPRPVRMGSVKQRGAIMLEIIINLFYRQSCRAALSAIRRQRHIWA
jgi:hypothetical protein